MKVELQKTDLVNLVMGCEPDYKYIDEFTKNNYGWIVGGLHETWYWKRGVLEDLNEQELWHLYQIAKL